MDPMMRRTLPLLLIAALAVAMACAEAAPYRFTDGQLETTYKGSFERTYDATLTSLGEMGMPVSQTQKDTLGANIEARRADGTPVSITLQSAGPSYVDPEKAAERTKASFRVGATGDESASRVIADSIAQRLGKPEFGY